MQAKCGFARESRQINAGASDDRPMNSLRRALSMTADDLARICGSRGAMSAANAADAADATARDDSLARGFAPARGFCANERQQPAVPLCERLASAQEQPLSVGWSVARSAIYNQLESSRAAFYRYDCGTRCAEAK